MTISGLFRGLQLQVSELMSITVTVPLVFYEHAVTGTNSPQEFSRTSATTVTVFNCFRVKSAMITQRMVISWNQERKRHINLREILGTPAGMNRDPPAGVPGMSSLQWKNFQKWAFCRDTVSQGHPAVQGFSEAFCYFSYMCLFCSRWKWPFSPCCVGEIACRSRKSGLIHQCALNWEKLKKAVVVSERKSMSNLPENPSSNEFRTATAFSSFLNFCLPQLAFWEQTHLSAEYSLNAPNT